MDKIEKPKKPLIYYYAIVLLVLSLMNLFAIPAMEQAKIQTVDYGTFMKMTENKEIEKVEITDTQILFKSKTDKDQVYTTGLMNDPNLTERLYESGAEFATDIQQKTSPFLSFLLSFLLIIPLFEKFYK